VAESVPGGTTTALALLLALGFKAHGRVSSSMADNAHAIKSRVAHEALTRLPVAAEFDPLVAVAALGDPMQAAAAGIAAGALGSGTPVLLAGGSQMIAVLALLDRLARTANFDMPADLIAVGTTRWVVDDPTADVVGLMAEVGQIPLLATGLSFAGSAHAALRRYEDFLVKEGVGAGGAAIAAALAAAVTPTELLYRVERVYEGVVGFSTAEA
jgi:uncharacterized protein (TIGR00303 family)